jgi:hypothetical protein
MRPGGKVHGVTAGGVGLGGGWEMASQAPTQTPTPLHESPSRNPLLDWLAPPVRGILGMGIHIVLHGLPKRST